MHRRRLLELTAGLGLTGLGACATPTASTAPAFTTPRIAPVRASLDRVFDVTVCSRPFRAGGPRIETEQVGDTRVVHNYGHGGSGWSLSWGSAVLAVRQAMASSPREVAVVGCGALGLTAALTAQAAGAKVVIYARELVADTRSARATGSFTPDSRIALTEPAGPAFAARWEEMARHSFHAYRRYLGLPGAPVEWTDRYILSDLSPEQAAAVPHAPDPLGFGRYEDRIRDLVPRSTALPPGATPFPTPYVKRTSSLTFNVANLGHTLLTDFRLAGGRTERREFNTLSDLGALPEKVVINCPGYGARALCRDESVVPVRGQISWLVPQAEVDYGVFYNGVSVLGRRDGIVVQGVSGGDMRGYGDATETPDRRETAETVAVVAELFSRAARRAA